MLKHLYVTTYHFHERREGAGLLNPVTRFLHERADARVFACYERVDGKGGFIVHDLPETAERSPRAGTAGAAAPSARRENLPASPGTRPNGAPAYYLARPASVWIAAARSRRGISAPRRPADAAIGGEGAHSLFPAGIETVGVIPVAAALPTAKATGR